MASVGELRAQADEVCRKCHRGARIADDAGHETQRLAEHLQNVIGLLGTAAVELAQAQTSLDSLVATRLGQVRVRSEAALSLLSHTTEGSGREEVDEARKFLVVAAEAAQAGEMSTMGTGTILEDLMRRVAQTREEVGEQQVVILHSPTGSAEIAETSKAALQIAAGQTAAWGESL